MLLRQANGVRVQETATRPVRCEADVYKAVHLGRAMAHKIGLEPIDQIRLETIIVELTFNALRHGGRATVTLECVERDGLGGKVQSGLQITVRDHSLHRVDLAKVLAGKRDLSGTDMRLSVHQLVPEFAIDSVAGHGTRVSVRTWAHSRDLPPGGTLAETGARVHQPVIA